MTKESNTFSQGNHIMKGNFSRIPFGSEKGLIIPFTESCQDCGVLLGENHLPGCSREECCRCHHALITCRCWALGLVLQLRMAVEMAGQFKWLGDALDNSPKKKDIQGKNMNLLEQSAILRLVFEQLDTLNPTIFKPVAFDGGGKKVFAEGDLAKALALSPQEIEEVMQIRFQQQHSPSQAWC